MCKSNFIRSCEGSYCKRRGAEIGVGAGNPGSCQRYGGWIGAVVCGLWRQIYDAVYERKFKGDIDNTIYCLIRSLRKKLETDPRYPEYIQTVRGAGYKFVIPEE